MGTTVQKTINAIVDRSSGVCWRAGSNGLALVLGQGGYTLVAEPSPREEILGRPVKAKLEDGTQMPDGHVLTPDERERAVRKILGL